MKKTLLFMLIFCVQPVQHAYGTSFMSMLVSKVPMASKNAARYLFSKNGIKDAVAAYWLGMGLTTIHELGHALTAKLFWGCPVNVVIGSSKLSDISGVKLRGLNPATGVSRFVPRDSVAFHEARKKNFLKHIICTLAGPVAGAVFSVLSFALLHRYIQGSYLCKAVALYGSFNHTLGLAGIGGINLPRSDINIVKELIKQYRQAQT